MYRVRPAARHDLPAIFEVDEALVGDRSDEPIIAAALDARRLLVAEEDAKVLAYLRWELFWDTIPLCLTARVLPEHQRRGIGRALYALAEVQFRRQGYAFWLSSTEDTNTRSQRFHEAIGFRRIGLLSELGQDVGEIFFRRDLG